MMGQTPINTARRLQRRKEQQRCLQCGRRIGIEQHHVAGRAHDPKFTTSLCEACHALATENLRRADVEMSWTPSSIERVRRALQATAVFLRMLSDAMWRWSELLVQPNRRD